MAQTIKLTISLPRSLVSFADDLAKGRNATRSKVFADILQEFAEQRKRDQLIEGYRAMAEQHREFAARALPLVNEVLPE